MYLHWRSGGLELAVVVGANGPKLQRAAWPGWPHGRERADGTPGAFTEACELGMVTPQHPAVYLRAFGMFVCGAFGVGRGFLSSVPPYLMQKQRERFLADRCQVACKQSCPLSFVFLPFILSITYFLKMYLSW